MGLKEKAHLVRVALRTLAVDRDPEQWMSVRNADFYRRTKIPAVPLRDLVAEIGEVSAVSIPGPNVQSDEMGSTPFYFAIGSIAKARRAKTVVEFGTYLGVGTITLAMNSPKESKIYTIDLPDDPGHEERSDWKFVESSRHRVGERFSSFESGAPIIQLRADSRKLRLIEEVKSAELILVDGGHTYEIVRADTENAMSVLAPGGIILWDDYNIFWQDHVVRFLDSLMEGSMKLRRVEGTSIVVGLRRHGD